jgi:hypothetical protein
MTDTKHDSGPLALRAALAIIKTIGNPALRDPAKNVTSGELAGIIQGEMNMTVMRKAIEEAMAEIEACHADELTELGRNDPDGGNGWARVHDRLCRAREILEDRVAVGNNPVDELEAADLMATALAVRDGRTDLKSRPHYQTQAETALGGLLTGYHLVRKA